MRRTRCLSRKTKILANWYFTKSTRILGYFSSGSKGFQGQNEFVWSASLSKRERTNSHDHSRYSRPAPFEFAPATKVGNLAPMLPIANRCPSCRNGIYVG